MDSPVPYVSNTIGELIRERERIAPLLVRQVSESVRWQQDMKVMMAMGCLLYTSTNRVAIGAFAMPIETEV